MNFKHIETENTFFKSQFNSWILRDKFENIYENEKGSGKEKRLSGHIKGNILQFFPSQLSDLPVFYSDDSKKFLGEEGFQIEFKFLRRTEEWAENSA